MMWRSSTDCQQPARTIVAVAGVAGSGKSTLGRALAATLAAPLLDLDSLTNPLLDALPPATLGGHWLTSPHAAEIRTGRYAALCATARDIAGTAGRLVLVAPFTAELRGGPEWTRLRDAVGPDLKVIHLHGADDLLTQRRAARTETRDRHRVPEPYVPPAVPVIELDAELTTDQQLLRALLTLGLRSPAPPADNPLFARDFDAVLFDLDGTLADSTASVLRSWRRFATETGVDTQLVAQNHGRRARALMTLLLPPERTAEGLARILEIETEDATSIKPTPGAGEFFAAVPEHRRAIVTSGSTTLATARLRGAGLPVPAVMVTADDVHTGKPDPEPFLLAAERLGVDPKRCLAVEDAPAGIRSARAAGCTVLAVTGTSPAHELTEADLIVDGLDRLRPVLDTDNRLRLQPVDGRIAME
ncbi:HAD-IA family hydrolase [Paractinoplanes lichenicola]|uniref:HAD-IA family hydrolase n=1 Tax=Paractinoplanes lichenicola TaxID=2802976 RepID=A0ABS1W344_9ACTN|nr:HAD-IA family hydrolase [Actinoplanes lichenicola]MBL7261144.1 HAD-IA family hydrolase [Actinoplanes lichenicola]